ncbi:hypothetical protein F5I97DRAFT_838358 [Phlebopus sp. FC_14]|nr:hypothetical protein F5I97DRAFT_838358 [Phlebopus sp. FC_14]
MNSSYHHNFRRGHRKRYSVSKLSSDTVQTLPEYSSPPAWSKQVVLEGAEDEESDRPPKYPETADEGDADTEGQSILYVSQHLVSPTQRSPSRIRRRKRAPAPATDPVLDMLLERSVHALEMSNALLQSSMSTNSSLSALLSSESGPDRSLEVRARNLSTRIRVNSGVHKTWMDNLEEISKGVDNLLDEGRPTNPPEESGVSRSLPTSTVPELRHRRRPSLLELNGSSSSSSQLQYSHPARGVLISPAPRALTQYVQSTADPEVIVLPSTLGIRNSESSHPADPREHSFTNMQESQLPSFIPDCQSDNATSAHNLLSNLAMRECHTPPPSSRLFSSRARRGSSSTTSTERGTKKKSSLSPSSIRTIRSSPDRSQLGREPSISRSRSATPKPRPSAPRRMTPPIEELSVSSSESTSSSDHPTGYRTVQSLRKILDEHPSSLSVNTFPRHSPKYPRTPTFLPVSPPPGAVTGTSTATASISRLFTKNRHSMSTRPPSPPVHSSLKRSVPPTPVPSPSTASLPDLPDNGAARNLGSGTASGTSTPKRISFAELPESYATSRQGSARIKERKGKRKSRKGKNLNSEDELRGWWQKFFTSGLSNGMPNGGSREERTEERMSRGWGSRPGFGTLDDWAV